MSPLEKDGISVITIVLNGDALIQETIESVISQEVKGEYIIIDGASTDGTLEIIERYKKYITHVVSAADEGIYQAINKGISLAVYPLVGLIHCGDSYTQNSLLNVYRVFKETSADVIYGDIRIKEQLGDKYFLKTLVADHTRLRSGMSVFHPSTFVKLAVYKKMGLYDSSYSSAADYDFLLKVFLQKGKFVHIPQVLAIFRTGGLSGSNFILSLRQNYFIRLRRLGKLRALRFLIYKITNYIYFSSRKKLIYTILGPTFYRKLKSARYTHM